MALQEEAVRISMLLAPMFNAYRQKYLTAKIYVSICDQNFSDFSIP